MDGHVRVSAALQCPVLVRGLNECVLVREPVPNAKLAMVRVKVYLIH